LAGQVWATPTGALTWGSKKQGLVVDENPSLAAAGERSTSRSIEAAP
jgi:hypothetical protein